MYLYVRERKIGDDKKEKDKVVKRRKAKELHALFYYYYCYCYTFFPYYFEYTIKWFYFKEQYKQKGLNLLVRIMIEAKIKQI